MEQLRQSNVRFDAEAHRYFLGSLELRGITGLIRERLGLADNSFADPTLGTEVHEEIELMGFGIPPKTEHGKAFKRWSEDNAVNIVAHEYIVTDGERYASPIDFVTDDMTLWDVKTFRRMTRDNLVRVTYQLSIYKYLFELQNGIEAKALKVVQVGETGCFVTDIEPLSVEEVKEMLYGQTEFRSSLIRRDGETEELARLYDLQNAIEELEARKKQLEESRDNLKKFLTSEMEKNGVLSWETDRVRVSYKKGYTKAGVDAKALKAEMPEVYERFKKESEVSPTISITIK